jgi:hypothetical protein
MVPRQRECAIILRFAVWISALRQISEEPGKQDNDDHDNNRPLHDFQTLIPTLNASFRAKTCNVRIKTPQRHNDRNSTKKAEESKQDIDMQ